MRRIWIEILNKIVNAKDQITITLKLSKRDIIIEIGNYKKIIRKFPHLTTIEKLIDKLKDAGCTINEIYETLNDINVTEKWTYIIKKSNNLTAGTQSTFLYNLNTGIEMEYIDCKYTGNVIPKQTGCILQRLVIDNDDAKYTYKVDINSIENQQYGLLTFYVTLKKEGAITNTANLVYDKYQSNLNIIKYAIINKGLSQETADTVMPLLKLYLKYL